ncbi:BQ5605_C002g01817 [Microbotryum silenes-dioicae]|uniref:BQ5605_C002g01817 protein n=1 Tax=Microbotryum silenes-dioicae TaxID=796604 RepID=A0A2X0MUM0_9BASI|nr:BQ5605_C002g01817 [Microbotryum silenes-dioicae]
MPSANHDKLQSAILSAGHKGQGHRVFARDKIYWPPGTLPLAVYASDSANNELCYYEVIDASAPSCHYIDAEFTRPSIDNSAEKALITRNAASYFPGTYGQLPARTPCDLASAGQNCRTTLFPASVLYLLFQRQRIISAFILTAGTPFGEPNAKRVITDILDSLKVLLSLRRRLGGSEGVVGEIWVLCCCHPQALGRA